MSQIVWMHTAQRIVEERSYQWVHPYTGEIVDVPDENNLPTFTDETDATYPAVLLDITTAAMLDHVWRNLTVENQAEFATYGLAGAIELGWKVILEVAIMSTSSDFKEEQPNE
jgi:hypothetical protein